MRAALVCLFLGLALAPIARPAVDFQRDIQPVLNKCLACHGRDEPSRQANLRLDTFEDATGRTGGHPGITPGDAAASRVIVRVKDDQRPMPPAGERLTEREIALLEEWIDAGAEYERHWSFTPPERLAPPAVSDASWPRNPIDSFVLARLDAEGLKPSPEADRHTLARRLALDLTGLPPDPERVAAFVESEEPEQAY